MQVTNTYAEKLQMKMNRLNKQKHAYEFILGSDKAFKGTVANPLLSSLLAGLLITLQSF